MTETEQQILRVRAMVLTLGTAIALFNSAIILLLLDIHAAVVADPKNVEATFYVVACAGVFGAFGVFYPVMTELWDWYQRSGDPEGIR